METASTAPLTPEPTPTHTPTPTNAPTGAAGIPRRTAVALAETVLEYLGLGAGLVDRVHSIRLTGAGVEVEVAPAGPLPVDDRGIPMWDLRRIPIVCGCSTAAPASDRPATYDAEDVDETTRACLTALAEARDALARAGLGSAVSILDAQAETLAADQDGQTDLDLDPWQRPDDGWPSDAYFDAVVTALEAAGIGVEELRRDADWDVAIKIDLDTVTTGPLATLRELWLGWAACETQDPLADGIVASGSTAVWHWVPYSKQEVFAADLCDPEYPGSPIHELAEPADVAAAVAHLLRIGHASTVLPR